MKNHIQNNSEFGKNRVENIWYPRNFYPLTTLTKTTESVSLETEKLGNFIKHLTLLKLSFLARFLSLLKVELG